MDQQASEQVEQYIDNCVKEYNDGSQDLKDTASYQKLRKEKAPFQKDFVLKLLEYRITMRPHSKKMRLLRETLFGVMRKNLKYNEEEWSQLFKTFDKAVKNSSVRLPYGHLPIEYAIQQIERFAKKNEVTPELKAFIEDLLTQEFLYTTPDSFKKYIQILKDVAGVQEVFVLDTNWFPYYFDKLNHKEKIDLSDTLNEVIQASELYHEADFTALMRLALTATQGKPTAKFQKKAKEYIEAIGKDKYRLTAHEMLRVLAEHPVDYDEYYSNYVDKQAPFVKGIIWIMENYSDKKTIEYLSQIFTISYTKGTGPVIAAAIGNACAYTLGNMRGKDGLGTLSRLKLKVKQNNIKKIIDNYLTEGAQKYGVSVEELKEMAVPDFKLVEGKKSIAFGEYRLDLSIEGNKVVQHWVKPDGKGMKSVPSIVKNDEKLTQKLKDVRKEIKEIQKVYAAQKQRIDNQFIFARTWDYASFEKYYLAHGLVSSIANRLIWILSQEDQKVSAMHRDGAWEDIEGKAIDWATDNITVSLWHPVFSDEAEIIAWRDRIMDIECQQPFKQAFRELYILTDAEINTVNYSNRMAAHILKQHVFKQLAILRDWKYRALMCFDDGHDEEIAQKEVSAFGITAEYWIDPLRDDNFSDTGSWYHVISDQVRFRDKDGVMDLVDVPPIVLSEIMRDVDLFVGVCSVGNDPEWQDNGGERQQNYWRAYSFGDLNELAKTRKAILGRLLPRLTKLKGKAEIDGKFLKVKGDLRTYKIHIGSGNILMEPNDQYLCIVPDRNPEKKTQKIFIPFEGDKGLSIVLSKAFLLAEDTKIKDTTITSQINR